MKPKQMSSGKDLTSLKSQRGDVKDVENGSLGANILFLPGTDRTSLFGKEACPVFPYYHKVLIFQSSILLSIVRFQILIIFHYSSDKNKVCTRNLLFRVVPQIT